jgi:hypothetical protein
LLGREERSKHEEGYSVLKINRVRGVSSLGQPTHFDPEDGGNVWLLNVGNIAHIPML